MNDQLFFRQLRDAKETELVTTARVDNTIFLTGSPGSWIGAVWWVPSMRIYFITYTFQRYGEDDHVYIFLNDGRDEQVESETLLQVSRIEFKRSGFMATVMRKTTKLPALQTILRQMAYNITKGD
jgi:dipeptidyl aminopeptidase/acylaminoacyl peptidase